MKTPHAHAQGVPVFDSKEIVLSRGGLFSLVVGGFQREFAEAFKKRLQFEGSAACAESGGLITLVELGGGVFLECRCEFFDLIK